MRTTVIDGKEYPAELHVLSRTFKIQWHEGKVICQEDDTLNQGLFDKDTQTLNVNRKMQDSAVAEVLLHELTHSFNWMWQNESIDREEEDLTNQFAITLMTVARQNPGFLAWLERMANA